jgi:hypothetical protein
MAFTTANTAALRDANTAQLNNKGNTMYKVNATLNTNGNGYWSNVKAAVEITGLQLAYINDEQDFGELRVRFNKATWDVNKQGLIYTDKQFMRELKELLTAKGFDASDVSYSEQGMQGDTYVSCDVGKKFINTFMQTA